MASLRAANINVSRASQRAHWCERSRRSARTRVATAEASARPAPFPAIPMTSPRPRRAAARTLPRGAMAKNSVLSSLPLEMLFFFNRWYDPVYRIIMLAVFIWKGTWLPYPSDMRSLLGLEIAMVFILCIIEQARLFLGSSGNKTETVGPLAWCLALSLPALVGYVYFMRLQIFVTRLDLVINAIGVGFVGLEIILGVFTVVTFVKARPRS